MSLTVKEILAALSVGIFIGMAIGSYIESSNLHRNLPPDRVVAEQRITSLQNLYDSGLETIARLSREKTTLTEQLTAAQGQLAKAQQEVEEAKAAKPDRYKIIKEGARTWRLDSATGSVCLLLASEVDWMDPTTTAQSCKAQ